MSNFPTHRVRRRQRKTEEVIVDFAVGTDPLHLNNSPDCVYLLHAGRVRLSNGNEAILDHLSSGDFFGEGCLLTPDRRSLAAHCLSPITVSAFRPSELLDRVQQDRRFASRLLKNLALRLDRCGQTIRDFVAEPAERRLARQLSRLAPNSHSSGWVRLPISPSNAEFARMVGTTPWRVSHFMQHFRRLGWLDRRPEIWVRREGLREYLEATAGSGLRPGQRRSPEMQQRDL